MKRIPRIAAQTLLICASALPFAAVAPGVLDAHRAHRNKTSSAPVKQVTPPRTAPSLPASHPNLKPSP